MPKHSVGMGALQKCQTNSVILISFLSKAFAYYSPALPDRKRPIPAEEGGKEGGGLLILCNIIGIDSSATLIKIFAVHASFPNRSFGLGEMDRGRKKRIHRWIAV